MSARQLHARLDRLTLFGAQSTARDRTAAQYSRRFFMARYRGERLLIAEISGIGAHASLEGTMGEPVEKGSWDKELPDLVDQRIKLSSSPIFISDQITLHVSREKKREIALARCRMGRCEGRSAGRLRPSSQGCGRATCSSSGPSASRKDEGARVASAWRGAMAPSAKSRALFAPLGGFPRHPLGRAADVDRGQA
jgi:hypothetical protein